MDRATRSFFSPLAFLFSLGLGATAGSLAAQAPPVETATLVAERGGAGPPGDFMGRAIAVDGGTALVGGSGAAAIVAREGDGWHAVQRLVPTDLTHNDGFGESVALQGNLAAIGSPGDDDVFPGSGSVYLFDRRGHLGWRQVDKLRASAPGDGHRFGTALALADDTLFVGAPGVEIAPFSSSGAVYVFERNGVVWSQGQRLQSDDDGFASPAGFGSALAFSGDTLLVGAPGARIDIRKKGAVYAYEKVGGVWTRMQTLLPRQISTDLGFGSAIALHGDLALIGRGNTHLDALAFVFERTAGEWREVQALELEREVWRGGGVAIDATGDRLAAGASFIPFGNREQVAVFERVGSRYAEVDRLERPPFARNITSTFGTAVAFDGDRILATDPEDRYAGFSAGIVFGYVRGETGWEVVDLIWPTVPDPAIAFGSALDVDRHRVAVGVPFDDAAAGDAGAVNVFVTDGDRWRLDQKVIAEDPGLADKLGTSVAVRGRTLVAGIPGHDGAGADTGAVAVFTRSEAWWRQTQLLTPSVPSIIAAFGTALDLDGGTLAVGAPRTEVPGRDRAGAVDIFESRGDGGWRWAQQLVASDGADRHRFGQAVDLDGDRLVVGAPEMAETPSSSTSGGAAYIFERRGRRFVEVQKLLGTTVVGGGDSTFAWSVALAGGLLVIGDPRAGEARVFELEDRWRERFVLEPADPENARSFGSSVAIVGAQIVVGAPFADNGSGVASQGAAYVYNRHVGTRWLQIRKIVASDGCRDDAFGARMASRGGLLAIAAPLRERALVPQGAVYLFARPAIFADGFESGDVAVWDTMSPD